MAENEKAMPDVPEDRPLLAAWQRWLEFLQLIAVLMLGAGLAVPFAIGFKSIGAWLGTAALLIAGTLLATFALRLIRLDGEIPTDQQFEVSGTRLSTLEKTGIPNDVIGALRDLSGETQKWTGSGRKFRDEFYACIGEKRGAVFLGRILPYLAIYVRSDAEKGEEQIVASTEGSTILAVDTKLPISRPLRL